MEKEKGLTEGEKDIILKEKSKEKIDETEKGRDQARAGREAVRTGERHRDRSEHAVSGRAGAERTGGRPSLRTASEALIPETESDRNVDSYDLDERNLLFLQVTRVFWLFRS